MPEFENDPLFSSAPNLQEHWNDVCRLTSILHEKDYNPAECGPVPDGATKEGLVQETDRLINLVDLLAATYDAVPDKPAESAPEAPAPVLNKNVPMM
jgi:hypothetical protein